MSDAQKQVSQRRLPPLVNSTPGGIISVDENVAATRSSGNNKENHHHNGGVRSSTTTTTAESINSIILAGPFRPPLIPDSSFRSNVFQNTPFRSEPDGGNREGDADGSLVNTFLDENPEFLDEYVRENVSLDTVERWLDEKINAKKQKNETMDMTTEQRLHNHASGDASFSGDKDVSAAARQQFISEFISRVQKAHADVRGDVLSQLFNSCANAIGADAHFLYLCNADAKYIWQYYPESSQPVNLQPVKEGSTVACYVAATKESIRVNQMTSDERFPDGTGVHESTASAVLCQAIVDSTGELLGVLELVRMAGAPYFTERDEQIISGFLSLGAIVTHYAEMYHSMHKQRRLNEFLLIVTKSIFQDIVSMDTVIMKIMNFAQTLVDADRTSLFLVDTKTDELYARIFDIGNGLDTKLQKEIRFPKAKGVAGYVATTGQTLNITDAYTDARFNRDIDIQTGYTTRTLLCMPIFIRGNIIGVVQMVNKMTGVFTLADENAFQTFAIYCGLALHHAKLYDKIRRSEQKYKVALEVLSYHSMCNEDEMNQMKSLQEGSQGIDTFEFNYFELSQMQMAREVVYMFEDLFNQESAFYFRRFDTDELTRFTLTVRKNYRRVPYHNWVHAFAVAQSMFCFLRSSKGKFSGIEAVALFVACLCHDLDHRGKNNDWMRSESTPLAAVYTTSTLEHHHFNQTITILQHEGHNIFSHLSSNEYKQVLGHIKECILSTDLASFFGNKARLNESVEQKTFDWNRPDHRKMVHGLAMTSCDLSACSKPWKVQYETVKVIFQEFYAQGDEEKALGRTPVPMMDRDTADKLPQHQIGFLVGICVPCYDLLQRLVPKTRPLVEGAKKNLQRWSEMVSKSNEERKQQQEAPDQGTILDESQLMHAESESETMISSPSPTSDKSARFSIASDNPTDIIGHRSPDNVGHHSSDIIGHYQTADKAEQPTSDNQSSSHKIGRASSDKTDQGMADKIGHQTKDTTKHPSTHRSGHTSTDMKTNSFAGNPKSDKPGASSVSVRKTGGRSSRGKGSESSRTGVSSRSNDGRKVNAVSPNMSSTRKNKPDLGKY